MLRFAISSSLRNFEMIEIQILLHGGIRHFYPMRNVFNTVLEVSLKLKCRIKSLGSSDLSGLLESKDTQVSTTAGTL